MGVRPPPDTTDEPDVVEFGIAALDARIRESDLAFPTDAATVERALGDEEVPYNAAGYAMPVSEALDRVDRERFATKQDLLNALHPVFEAKRESVSTGFLAQLRALVPF